MDVFVPDGQITFDIWVQGVSGRTGMVTITASQSLFTDGMLGLDIVEPVFRISDINTSQSVGADDPFQVETGIANSAMTSFERSQIVSAVAPVQVLVTSSDDIVGELDAAAATGASVVVEVPSGESRSASSVAAGGVAFLPLAAGSTTITAINAAFFDPFPDASVLVNVSP